MAGQTDRAGAGERSGSEERVARALAAAGLENTIRELPRAARTAPEAAAALGCDVAQIAKSIVFRGVESGEPVLVVASGANRVDEARVAALVGEGIERASPELVRAATGFAIGGVAPCAHPAPLRVLLDRDLLRHELVWAAAGSPRTVFSIRPDVLPRLSGGTVADVREAP